MAKELQAYKLVAEIKVLGAQALAMLRSVDVSATKTQAQLNKLSTTSTNAGRSLSLGLTAPLTGFAYASVRAATQMDSLERGLTAVTGSADQTRKQLVRLRDVAKLPGLGFKEAVQGSINLQAAGYNAQLAERSLAAFGNALATVGKGKSELDGVILALSQIESKGKVSAEEINQLAERVPQIRKAMIAAFGTADTEILQKSKITARQFVEGVVAELEKLPKATGGAQNSFENLADTAEQSLSKIGMAVLKVAVPALDKLAPKIETAANAFDKLSPEAKDTALALGLVAIAAGPVMTVIGKVSALFSSAVGVAVRLTGALRDLAGGLAIVRGLAPGFLSAASGTVAVGLGALVQTGGDQPTVARARQRDFEIAQRKAREEASRRIGPRVEYLQPKPIYQTPDALQLPTLALPPQTPPKPTTTTPKIKLTGGKNAKGGKSKEAEERARQDALAQLVTDGLDAILRIDQDGWELRERALRDSYDAGLITTSNYYREAAAIAQHGVKLELAIIEAKQEQLTKEQGRYKPGSADALRVQAQINQLDLDKFLKFSDGIRLSMDNLREFKQALGTFAEVDLSRMEQAVETVPPIITAARARLAELTAQASEYDRLEAELTRDREAIQTRVAQGVITETTAKREMIVLEASYRDELIKSLEAKKAMAGLDAAAIAALDAQIERVKRLGLAEPKKRKPIFVDESEAIEPQQGKIGSAANYARAGLASVKDQAKDLGRSGFDALAQGIGGIVQDFVLLGETGPAAMRKLTASVLAGLAAQAAVKSVFYAAEGFANLIFNPPAAAGYFIASGLMAGIAVGTGLAGRALAGKNKNELSAEQQRQYAVKEGTSEGSASNRFERRAMGGPVTAGRPYIVGERQPELFVPRQDGYIFPRVPRYMPRGDDAYATAGGGLDRRTAREFEQWASSRRHGMFGGVIEKLLRELNVHFSRLQPVNGDDFFVRYAERNARAVAKANLSGLDQDGQLATRLGQRIA